MSMSCRFDGDCDALPLPLLQPTARRPIAIRIAMAGRRTPHDGTVVSAVGAFVRHHGGVQDAASVQCSGARAPMLACAPHVTSQACVDRRASRASGQSATNGGGPSTVVAPVAAATARMRSKSTGRRRRWSQVRWRPGRRPARTRASGTPAAAPSRHDHERVRHAAGRHPHAAGASRAARPRRC